MRPLIWIPNGTLTGGRVTLRSAVPGKLIIEAAMYWPDRNLRVRGKISLSVEGALENLEDALQENAADEMTATGQV